jgi:U32 family peptidase
VEMDIENEYIMSPKDLNTINFLDRILDAGVSVLKIEGRGRSPEYVKVVTAVYREAVEAVQNGTFDAEKVGKWNERLSAVYNRGFWDGYYLGRKTGEWTENYGSQATQKKVYVGKINNYFNKLQVAEIKMETQWLDVGDSILIIGPTTGVFEDVVSEIRVDLQSVKTTIKGENCSIPAKEILRRGDKVYKLVEAAKQ